MANKPRPKPRWRYMPPGIQSQIHFIKDKVEELAAICGKDDEGDVSELSELLNDENSALQDIKYIYETDVSVPEQRAALRELAKGARHLVLRLEEADLKTRRAIDSAYRNVQPAYEQDIDRDDLKPLASDVERLRRLCSAIEYALSQVKRGGGRPSVSHLADTCRILVEIYEHFSGKEFTFDWPAGPRGNKEFVTDGTRFVAAAALVLWPGTTTAKLTTAMIQRNQGRTALSETPPKKGTSM